MHADQMRGRRDQIRVVPRWPAVGKQGDVFQAGTNSVPSIECTLIDGPTRDSIPVVNLRERDPRGHHNLFHPGSVLKGNVRIGVQRLDQDATAPVRQSGMHEGARVFNAQQSSLDINAPGQQQLAKRYNSRFALIRGNQVREFLPSFDDSESLAWIRNNRCRRS